MKAAHVTRYGPPEVIRIGEAPKPVPGPGDLLVRVHAATVNRTDSGELRPGLLRIFIGLLRPNRQIFGMDFAGVVEALGEGVTAYGVGDRVFGMAPSRRNGAQAEYVLVPQDGAVALIPEGLPFEKAVVCEGAYYANSSMTDYDIGPAHRLMVYGASGAIGTAAVQLAKARGAHVTAVTDTARLALAKTLGADEVIDYTAGDFTRSAARFDYILDAVGKLAWSRARRLLKPGGVFMMTDLGPGGANAMPLLWSAVTRNGRVTVPLPKRENAPAFVALMRDLMAAGQFRAVIDRLYPLDEIAEAYRYVMGGGKTGIVVVEVAPGER